MSFLKLIKLDLEVRLSDQLQFPIYIVLFVVDGFFIERLVIIVIIWVLVVIVVGHDWLLPSDRTLSAIAGTPQRGPSPPVEIKAKANFAAARRRAIDSAVL